jgi:hypothetical protein
MASRAKLLLGCAIVACVAGVLGSAHAAPTAGSVATIVVPPPIALRKWNADTDNLIPVQGTVELNGQPVSGLTVRVDTFLEPRPTDAQGHFTYLVDGTLMGRHVVTVANTSQGKIAGVALTSDQSSALGAVQGAITVDYAVHGCSSRVTAPAARSSRVGSPIHWAFRRLRSGSSPINSPERSRIRTASPSSAPR